MVCGRFVQARPGSGPHPCRLYLLATVIYKAPKWIELCAQEEMNAQCLPGSETHTGLPGAYAVHWDRSQTRGSYRVPGQPAERWLPQADQGLNPTSPTPSLCDLWRAAFLC